MLETRFGNNWSYAATCIRSGGVIAFPTDTVFGLGCSILSDLAIEKLLSIKGRGAGKGLPVLIANEHQASSLVEVNCTFQKLATRFWPGALTIVAPALKKKSLGALSYRGTIGVRIPDFRPIRLLIEQAGCPIIGTSANRTGKSTVSNGKAAYEEFDCELDYIIDGEVLGTNASTVINVAETPARLLRTGNIRTTLLRKVLPDLIVDEITR